MNKGAPGCLGFLIVVGVQVEVQVVVMVLVVPMVLFRGLSR